MPSTLARLLDTTTRPRVLPLSTKNLPRYVALGGILTAAAYTSLKLTPHSQSPRSTIYSCWRQTQMELEHLADDTTSIYTRAPTDWADGTTEEAWGDSPTPDFILRRGQSRWLVGIIVEDDQLQSPRNTLEETITGLTRRRYTRVLVTQHPDSETVQNILSNCTGSVEAVHPTSIGELLD